MRKVIYSSRAAQPFDGDDLRALMAQSRAANTGRDLTGLLIFSGGSFLQLLEGPDDAVGSTYARIMADPRHTDFRLLTDEGVTGRRFPDWAMGFESPSADDLAQRLPGFRGSAYPLADPDTITDGVLAESLLAIYGRA